MPVRHYTAPRESFWSKATKTEPRQSNESDLNRETIAKRTIAERIADKTGLGQTQTLAVIQQFLNEIIDELADGNRLEFRDFGVFETVLRKPRTALNPKTLEKVPVASKVVVKFKVGRLMKEKVSQLSDRVTGQVEGLQRQRLIKRLLLAQQHLLRQVNQATRSNTWIVVLHMVRSAPQLDPWIMSYSVTSLC